MGPGAGRDGPGPGAGRDGPAGAHGPVLRVIRGDATAEEIAAVVAALAARAAGRGPVAPPRRGPAWADRAAMLRGPVWPGPDGWRASARPG
jgi:hypothetical protein